MSIGTRSDEAKVLLGCPRRGPETVGNYDPATDIVGPGVAVCLNSDTEVQAGAANPVIGVSRGVSMNHTDKNSVTQAGFEVPLKIADLSAYAALVVGDLTFTAKVKGVAGNDITIALVDGGTAGSETVDVTDAAIVVNMDDGVSTAAQIKAAVDGDADAAALVSVAVATGEESTAQDAATADNLADGKDLGDFVVPGDAVFVNDTTGLATEEDTGTTEMNWKYASATLDGIDPADGSTAPCALVDM